MKPVIAEHDSLTPIEVLDRNILDLCTRINVETYELLVLIREFDERAGWVQWGLSNCAEWLAWRCDLSMSTALEKVRVAHALKSLPAITAAFSSGELSFTKVRELTRAAERDNEDAYWPLPCVRPLPMSPSAAGNCGWAPMHPFPRPHAH